MEMEAKGDRRAHSLIAFFGRRSSQKPHLSPKSNLRNESLELVLLLLFGGMIAVVACVHFFGAR
jgi:hypothetical protein